MRIELLLLLVINLALVLTFWRLVRGPTLADRVVALDLITTLIIGDIVVFAIANDQPLLLDLVLVLALIAFLATVAFAHYIEKGGATWRKS